MPDEPNKEMDEMLRAYAQERRKGPEVELHPATRKVLQGEVARVYGSRRESRPWWQRLRAFWPQIAFGGGLCLVLGIAVLSMRQPQKALEQKVSEPQAESLGMPVVPLKSKAEAEITNAKQAQTFTTTPTESERSDPALEKQAQSRGVARPADNRESRERVLTDEAARGEADLALQKKADAALATGTAAARTESFDSVPLHSSGNAAPRPSVAAASAPALTISPVKLLRAAELTNLGAARRLNFVQVSNVSPLKASAGVPVGSTIPVLTSFQLEQFGTNVRFLDRDGSIYLGAMEAQTNAAAAVALKDDPARFDNSTAYFFRVQGTNKTLGTDLVLTGQYFEQTNQAPTALDTFAIDPKAKARQQTPPRHLIIGNATIGTTNEVPVRAVSNEQ